MGALSFLRELSAVLAPESTAVILEYGSTPTNQPSWFGDHFECGISFKQLASYASRLGLEWELATIDEILDLPGQHELLTMDVFTSQERVAREHPGALPLWQAKSDLPVLAYTRDCLAETLSSEEMGLSQRQVTSVLSALDDSFCSIHDKRFDTKNPTTWSYEALLLRKRSPSDWKDLSEPVAVSILADALDLSEDAARAEWRSLEEATAMGPLSGIDPITLILGGAIYDLVKRFGYKSWLYFLQPHVEAWVNSAEASEGARARRLLRAVKSAVKPFVKSPTGRDRHE